MQKGWAAGALRTPFLLVLCVVLATSAQAAQWIDALGRNVEIPEPPRRIVSLVPSVTEILFALGLGDRVVGVTRYCDFPPEAASKPQVGGYADPSLETLVGAAPDLIVAGADSTKPAIVARLEALGIPVFVVYPRTLAGTVETVRIIGRVTGAPGPGNRLAGQLEQNVRIVEEATAHLPKARVLLVVMLRPFVVAGPGTLGDDLIRTAGGQNAVPSGPSRYPTWGPEAVLSADPDVIVVAGHPGETEPTAFFQRWPELQAVQAGRVHEVPADWIHRPGPRLALGLKALARAIHPGSLPEDSL